MLVPGIFPFLLVVESGLVMPSMYVCWVSPLVYLTVILR